MFSLKITLTVVWRAGGIGQEIKQEDHLQRLLEQSKGADYTDELVSHITTSTLTFTRDDDVVYNVHAYLLRVLEEAQ